MRYAYIDPSAWVKRYYRETGTELTNILFDTLLRSRPARLLCSRIGMTEVIAVLNHHRNAGRVTQALFNMACILRQKHGWCGSWPRATVRLTPRFGCCSCTI